MDPQEVIRLYHEEGLTLHQVGRRLGISGERVRQVLAASGRGTRRRGRAGLEPTTLPPSVRLSVVAAHMLEDLEPWLGLKRSAVMELAIRKVHQAEAATRTAEGTEKKPRGRRAK